MLIQLKNQLSAEKQKPKRERNKTLIDELHEKINSEKQVLNKTYEERRKHNLTAEIQEKRKLDMKKSAQYRKIRDAKKSKLAKKKK